MSASRLNADGCSLTHGGRVMVPIHGPPAPPPHDDALRLAARARTLLARGFDPVALRQDALRWTKRNWDLWT
jgi:hypothetical protein